MPLASARCPAATPPQLPAAPAADVADHDGKLPLRAEELTS
jgi:hypothetical protein